MRLSAEKVKEAFLHADPHLRNAAASYFGDSFSRDASVMPLVIQAIEKYGWQAAFPHYYFLRNLVQTESTARWLVQQVQEAESLFQMRVPVRLEMEDDGEPEEEIHFAIACWRALISADVEVLRHCEAEILGSVAFDDEEKEMLRHRIGLESRTVAELWSELNEACRNRTDEQRPDDAYANEGSDPDEDVDPDDSSFSDDEFRVGFNFVHALSRHRDQIAEKLPEILENPESTNFWLLQFSILLAGEAGIEGAIAALLKIIPEPLLALDDICQDALIRIGTDAVVAQLIAAYETGSDDLREPVGAVLANIHSDLSVQACLDLLKIETDDVLAGKLYLALLLNFSTDGIEPARQYILEATDIDPDLLDLRRALLNASLLLGQPFEEFDAWQEAAQGDAEFKEQWYDECFSELETDGDSDEEDFEEDEFDDGEIDDDDDIGWQPLLPKPIPLPSTTFVHESPHVGRNDPCPCGSGRKYKKCCYGKQDSGLSD